MLSEPAEEGVEVAAAVRVRVRIAPLRNHTSVNQEAGKLSDRR